MGNTTSSDSCTSSLNDLRYKTSLVNQNYGSLYIRDSDHNFHSNFNLNSKDKKSKLNKFLKFISPKNDVQKRDPNKVKNRKGKNFITKSLVYFKTPSQKECNTNSPSSIKCSTPLESSDYKKLDLNSKSKSMFVDQEDLNTRFKSRFSLKSNKSTKLNSSTDSKNDSGILSDYKRNEESLKNSVSAFSIGENKCENININNYKCSSSNRRLSITSAAETAAAAAAVHSSTSKNVNIRRTTTFHSTKVDNFNTSTFKTKPTVLNIPHETSTTTTTTAAVAANEKPKSQKIVVQASTSELLRCFTAFLLKKYPVLIKADNEPLTSANRLKADSRDVISWLRSADRALLIQGWQEIAFMNPVNVVFVYLLVRDSLSEPETVYDLQCHIMSCLYLAFSYMGNEISYPLKPFLIEDDRDVFWTRVVSLMNLLSANMLRINRDARFFTELFYELKSYSVQLSPMTDQCLSAASRQSQSIQKSITVNSFKSYKNSKFDSRQDNNSSNNCRTSNYLIYSSCSKNVLKPSYDLTKSTQGSYLYTNNDEPLIKPIAYCI